MRPHLRAVIKFLRQAGADNVRIEHGGSTPVVIIVGSIKRASMCCRIALETLTAASTMLSAIFAGNSVLRGE